VTKKSLLISFLAAILIAGLISVSGIHFGTVQASTIINGGIISLDTVWVQANSPYIITAPILINSGVTLTIEPGVTVYLNSASLRVNGTLNARGTTTNKINLISNGTSFEPGSISFMGNSGDWNEATNSGSIIENAVISSTQSVPTIFITDASPKLNNNTISANTRNYYLIEVDGGSPIISKNTINGPIGLLYAGSVWSNASISDNVISGGDEGVEISCTGTPTIERNVIMSNNGMGIYLLAHSGDRTPIIRNNTIAKNSFGIKVLYGGSPSFLPIIAFNNFQDNKQYNIYFDPSSDASFANHNLDATLNWWGTTDTQAISQSIYDKNDYYNLGTVTFIPFLTEPNPAAPTAPASAPNPTPTPTPIPSPSPSPTTTPMPTQISISVDASSTAVGAAVNVNGRLLDSNGTPLHDKPIILSYAVAGSTSWFQIASGTTNAAGEYSIQWVNTASGTFTLKAEWNGDADHPGASSTTTLSFLPFQNQNVFLVASNGTVSALAFNSTSLELSFTVNGTSGTTGYVKVTIAKSLVSNAENIKVYLDGNQLNYEVTSNANAWLLTFTYKHSNHQVRISLATNAATTPFLSIEFWIGIAAAIIIFVISIGLLVYLKKRKR
jgi:hypothetical protein